MRSQVAKALLRFHREEHLLGFRDALESDDVVLRRHAHHAFRDVFLLGHRSAGFALLLALADDDDELRREAEQALLEVSFKSVAPLLERGVQSDEAQVRTVCFSTMATRVNARFSKSLQTALFSQAELGATREALHRAFVAHRAHLPVKEWRRGQVDVREAMMALAALGDDGLLAVAKQALLEKDARIR
ncbi:MAG: hypothetical protein GY822_22595 [Deltaproteobacteria bacterium]|nr:hypothetical protein [Deltaproteobacteria bacterium]